MSNILELYSNPSNPGAFRGISGFIENNGQTFGTTNDAEIARHYLNYVCSTRQ